MRQPALIHKTPRPRARPISLRLLATPPGSLNKLIMHGPLKNRGGRPGWAQEKQAKPQAKKKPRAGSFRNDREGRRGGRAGRAKQANGRRRQPAAARACSWSCACVFYDCSGARLWVENPSVTPKRELPPSLPRSPPSFSSLLLRGVAMALYHIIQVLVYLLDRQYRC
jgi:hypothetical protein